MCCAIFILLHSQNSLCSKFTILFSCLCVTIESQNSFYSFDKNVLLEKSNYGDCALALFIRVFYNEQQCFLSCSAPCSEHTYTQLRVYVYFLTAIFELFEKREIEPTKFLITKSA